MSTAQRTSPPPVHYPDSDGRPMAENTLQFRWIVTIKEGLDACFRDRPDVFVAGDLLWYPVEGEPTTCMAPDALVALGRPKGDRGSYRQWKEEGIAPQAVFEVFSPGNRPGEMAGKRAFYERHGVQEYVVYDPDDGTLEVWVRSGDRLVAVADPSDWTSPRLGVRLELDGVDLVLTGPDGRPFQSYGDLFEARERADARAEQERLRAEQEHARAEQADARAEQADARAERLAERLRALGIGRAVAGLGDRSGAGLRRGPRASRDGPAVVIRRRPCRGPGRFSGRRGGRRRAGRLRSVSRSPSIACCSTRPGSCRLLRWSR